jgi:DNA-directed RNA polymerase beta' subunit
MLYTSGEGYLQSVVMCTARKCIAANDITLLKEYCRHAVGDRSGLLRRNVLGGAVNPSIRSVIVPAWPDVFNQITIPRSIANNVRVPVRNDDSVVHTTLKDGIWAMVVRHPCITSYSIQPMVVRLSDQHAIGFPVWLCSQYNADFM